MRLRYTDRAREDVELALVWYEQQRKGLGLDFLDAVEQALRTIVEHPERYAVRYQRFRGCLVKHFPFWVLYTIEKNEIILHSVFHHRLDPSRRP